MKFTHPTERAGRGGNPHMSFCLVCEEFCLVCEEFWPAVLLDDLGACPECLNPQSTQEVESMRNLLTPTVRKRVYELGGAALAALAAFKLISEKDASAWQETLGSVLALLARFNVTEATS